MGPTLTSCLWSLTIFPSLPGSRLTSFYRGASAPLTTRASAPLTTRQRMVEFYYKPLLYKRIDGTIITVYYYKPILLCTKIFLFCFVWCPCMTFNVSVQHNGGFLPGSKLLIQCYYHPETRLNAFKRFCIFCSLLLCCCVLHNNRTGLNQLAPARSSATRRSPSRQSSLPKLSCNCRYSVYLNTVNDGDNNNHTECI